MKKRTTIIAVICVLLAVVIGFFSIRNINYSIGKEQGYLTGYSIGYVDGATEKKQESQVFAGKVNPHQFGNSKWKGFMMGFSAGYNDGYTQQTN